MKSDNHKNQEVFQKFKNGQSDGFTKLYNEWNPSVCRFANSMINDLQEAKDVTEDCFIKMWERRTNFSSISGCKSFLFTSVRNACINIIRHRRVILSGQREIQYLHSNNETLLDGIITSQLSTQVNSAVDRLPPQCRKIFYLLFRDGKNTREVAEMLNLSLQTIKTHRKRGLAILRKQILPSLLLVFTFIQQYV
jgi:RNA polymerase sigma-70 factor (family 1)